MKKKVPCEVYSRVVGFLTPVRIGNYDHWNPGKIAEWKDRVPYGGKEMLSHPFVKDVESTPVVVVEAT